jgi:hypothetical protein
LPSTHAEYATGLVALPAPGAVVLTQHGQQQPALLGVDAGTWFTL